MRTVFADTLYWIALINSRDQWHRRAVSTFTLKAFANSSPGFALKPWEYERNLAAHATPERLASPRVDREPTSALFKGRALSTERI